MKRTFLLFCMHVLSVLFTEYERFYHYISHRGRVHQKGINIVLKKKKVAIEEYFSLKRSKIFKHYFPCLLSRIIKKTHIKINLQMFAFDLLRAYQRPIFCCGGIIINLRYTLKSRSILKKVIYLHFCWLLLTLFTNNRINVFFFFYYYFFLSRENGDSFLLLDIFFILFH